MLTVSWQIIIPVSFPLEDEHDNEYHVIRKSQDATQQNVLTWCISVYQVIGLKQTRSIKYATLKAAKNIVGVAVYWEEY